MWWYVSGQYGGGAWSVANTPTANVLVGDSDLRCRVGVEMNGRSMSLEFGYVFSRTISVDNVALVNPSRTFLAQASLMF